MRIHGKKIEGLNVEEIFIPRGEDVIVFKAQAVIDFEECNALNPRPKARKAKNRAGETFDRVDEPTYIQAIEEWSRRQTAWMIVKSLQATEGLEWDTVNLNDVNTWLNWQEELKAAGFVEAEITRIFQGVVSACGLSEDKVEKARQRFLTGRQVEQARQLSQREEAVSMPSGGLVNDSE